MNGFLVVGDAGFYNGIRYCGVDNDPFPIDDEEFEFFLDDKQSKTLYDTLFSPKNNVSFLDFSTAELYYSYCISKKLNVRLLYAELNMDDKTEIIDLKSKLGWNIKFLGYDVADSAYDFYSVLLMDVIIRPNLLKVNFTNMLNKNGLFSNINDAEFFISERENAKKTYDKMIFEKGEYTIISLYSVLDETGEIVDGSVSGNQVHKIDKK